jgi:hypothetical protein
MLAKAHIPLVKKTAIQGRKKIRMGHQQGIGQTKSYASSIATIASV